MAARQHHCNDRRHTSQPLSQASSALDKGSEGPKTGMPMVKAVLVLDSDGERVATKYYDSATFPTKEVQVRGA